MGRDQRTGRPSGEQRITERTGGHLRRSPGVTRQAAPGADGPDDGWMRSRAARSRFALPRLLYSVAARFASRTEPLIQVALPRGLSKRRAPCATRSPSSRRRAQAHGHAQWIESNTWRLGLRLNDRSEHTAFAQSLGQLGKAIFDSIEPQHGRECELEGPVWMPAKPCPDVGMFYGWRGYRRWRGSACRLARQPRSSMLPRSGAS